jgi:nucleoid-associated protein YgaU
MLAQFVGSRQPKSERTDARLERVQHWLATNNLAGVTAEPHGGVITVSGDLPTAVHLRWVEEGVLRAARGPVDFANLAVIRPAVPPTVTYRVRAGDSYWAIAQRRYGTAQVWKVVAEANKNHFPPGDLLPGDEIILPDVTFSPRKAMRVSR